jgi:hypothetical protein
MTPELVKHVTREIDARFVTDDANMVELVRNTRRAAARTMQRYMVATSTLAIGLVVFPLLPVALFVAARHGISHLARNVKRALVVELDHSVIRSERFEWAAAQLKAA